LTLANHKWVAIYNFTRVRLNVSSLLPQFILYKLCVAFTGKVVNPVDYAASTVSANCEQ